MDFKWADSDLKVTVNGKSNGGVSTEDLQKSLLSLMLFNIFINALKEVLFKIIPSRVCR